MSSQKRYGYNYDSFDRFGDDLCQLLCTYFSISDKIRLEYVSKRWKYLIFNKQNKLCVGFDPKHLDSIDMKCYLKNGFEVLVKKLKFIEEIRVGFAINEEMFDVLVNNCSHLKKISLYLDFENFKSEKLVEFGVKCGKRLTHLSISHMIDENIISFLSLTPKLKSICFHQNLNPIITQFMPKLEEIKFRNVYSYDEMKSFADKYCKQMKKIGFNTIINSETHEEMNTIRELSRFENLKSLELKIDDYSKLELNESLLQTFGELTSLEKLDLDYYSFTDNLGQIKYLKNCRDLRQLKLHFNHICDNHLIGIHLYLPNLRYISIHDKYHYNTNGIKDYTLENLAKIQNLSHLFIYSPNITDSGVRHLIENSPKIRNIVLNSPLDISKTTIDAMIKRALNNSKIEYKFQFWSKLEDQKLNNFLIPNNLKMKQKF